MQLRNEQFGFRPKHSTALQLTSHVESVQELWKEDGNCVVFLDVAKAFDTVWFDGLLYKLAVPNFPSNLVKAIYSHMNSPMFEASFQTTSSPCRWLLNVVV